MFIEVKKDPDKISQAQLTCIAQIRAILRCPVDIVYLCTENQRREPKTYTLDLGPWLSTDSAYDVAAPDTGGCAAGAGELSDVRRLAMKKHHRCKGHNPQAGVRVGVAWYTRESWEQLRQLASDPELLEPTYEEWVEMAERSLSQVHAAGMHPERIELNIGRLAEWCREKKRPVDAAARAEFTAQNLRAKDEDPHKTGGV